jgi:hypothetical protein
MTRHEHNGSMMLIDDRPQPMTITVVHVDGREVSFDGLGRMDGGELSVFPERAMPPEVKHWVDDGAVAGVRCSSRAH